MTYQEWLDQNRDELAELLHKDQEEALYRVWFAGYEAGMDNMIVFTKTLFVERKITVDTHDNMV
jgi:hypothetical protein